MQKFIIICSETTIKMIWDIYLLVFKCEKIVIAIIQYPIILLIVELG